MTSGWLLVGPATGTTSDGWPVWRVPLEDFLAQVRPVYGGPEWDDVLRSMLDDADERERVNTLAALVPGGFRQPVIVDDKDREVRNGMHRVVATIVAGGTHLDVTDRYSAVDRPQLRVEFALELPPEHPYEDVHEAASSFLWSFPVGEEWAETDSLYNADPLIGGYWYWPADRAEDLVEAMTARAAARGAILSACTSPDRTCDGRARLSRLGWNGRATPAETRLCGPRDGTVPRRAEDRRPCRTSRGRSRDDERGCP